MKNIILFVTFLALSLQTALAYPVRTVTLDCSERNSTGTVALTIIKKANFETQKLTLDVSINADGKYDGQNYSIKGKASFKTDSSKINLNASTYEISNSSDKTMLSVKTLESAMKNNDSEAPAPGFIIKAKTTSDHPDAPYLIVRGTLGFFPQSGSQDDEIRAMNATLFSSDGKNSLHIVNGDMVCKQTIND